MPFIVQEVLLILVLVANIFLALFVYKNNPNSATNRIFSILAIVTSLWLPALLISLLPEFSQQALFWSRVSIFLATPMNFSFALLAHTLPSTKFRVSMGWFVSGLFVVVGVMVLTLSPYAFKSLDPKSGVIEVGWGIVPFAATSLYFTIFSVVKFFQKIRKSVNFTERQQLLFVGIGIALMLTMLFVTVLVPVLFFQDISLVPLAPVWMLLFLGMTAFAIIKHGFLDVRLILARAVTFLLVGFLFSLLYALFIYLVIHFYILKLPYFFARVVGIFFLAFAVFWFDSIYARLNKRTSRYFLRGDYDKDQLLAVVTKTMTETIDLDDLSDATLSTLKGEMRLESAGFLIVEKHKISAVKGDSFSFSRAQLKTLETLFHRVPSSGGSSFFLFSDLEDFEMKEVFRSSQIELAATISLNEEEVAILLLGTKLSGERFNQRDIDFLSVFAAEAGIAIQNAKAYTEIKNFSKKLEQRVAERTKELKESQERELEKAASVVKLKDEFVYVAAHELRTPITAIRGFLELVSEAEGSYPKDVQEDLDNIKFASDHLNQLVNDLLEVARSESQVIKIQSQPLDVVELIHKILAELSSLIQKKNIKLAVGDYHRDFKAMADPEKLKEVLVNLISNAIKYNKDGGALEINILPVEENLLLEIRDSGYGIPQDQQAKIFQKFFRASSSNTQGIIGTGLGLFITRMLIEKMGGSIFFSSLEGHGTTFSIALPKA